MHVGEYVKGGVATYLDEVIKYQNECEEISDVYLVLSEKNSEKEFNIKNNNLIFYPYERKVKNFIGAMRSIWKSIKENEPDIVHVHSTFAGFFVRVPLFFSKKKYKIVYCSHGWSFCMQVSNMKKILYSSIEKVLSLKTDKIINISFNEYQESIRSGLPKDKSRLIYNGVSAEFRKNSIDYRLDSTKINLLFVGRFDHQKGLDILLDFFSHYQNEKIRLYTIGDSILKNTDLIIPDNVVSIGWINHDEIDSYYNLFDAVIIPSRWEGFGLVAIEAMKNAKAIIVSDRGALPEFVGNDNGYVFSLENLESLKDILDHLDKKELIVKGLRGLEEFNQKYTSNRMNQEILDLYKEMI